MREYSQGEYVLRSPTTLPANSPFESHTRSALPGLYENISLAVDARLVDPGPEQWVKLACRVQDESSYDVLAVNPNVGALSIARRIYGTWMPLANSGAEPSPAIHRGDQPNHLELTCRGAQLEASINGVPVASVGDGTFRDGRLSIGAGHTAFFALPYNAPLVHPIEAHFSGLVVTQR